MTNWKDCKFCGTENGNCLNNCKACGNDRFWSRKTKEAKRQ